MKVDGPSKSREAGKAKSKHRTGSAAGGFDALVSGASSDAAPSSGVSQATPASAVDALLAVQEVADATSGASRGKARAEFLLQKLDEIRMGLLCGAIPQKTLEDLTRTIQMKRDRIDDPRLSEILDEIDLRAQVELAKIESAIEAASKRHDALADPLPEGSGGDSA